MGWDLIAVLANHHRVFCAYQAAFYTLLSHFHGLERLKCVTFTASGGLIDLSLPILPDAV